MEIQVCKKLDHICQILVSSFSVVPRIVKAFIHNDNSLTPLLVAAIIAMSLTVHPVTCFNRQLIIIVFKALREIR